MKKYSLKPLGDSCIHILCKSAFLIGLLMTFSLAACSDDDDDTVTPIFPEKQNIICNAGDTREFTFTANTNWSLASSAIWCKFKTDDMEEFTLSGAAGTHTVTLMVTGDNQKVNNISVAKLELTMGGQTIVIGEITRSKVKYELTIYDADGNEVDEETGALVVGYKDFAKFSVEANFRFAATNLPGWVELEGGSMVGAVNKRVSGGLQIIENEFREKYPVDASNENVITFSDEEGRVFRSVKVSYAGMPKNILDLTLPSSNKYGWTVSLDGKTFTHDGGGVAGTGSSNTTFKNRFPFTVKTFNDEYVVVFVVKGLGNNDLYLMEESDEWMSYEDDPKDGNIKLKVNEFIPEYGQTERVGYVLVFTKKQYEDIGEDKLEETIINGEDIVYEYEQNNLVIQFTQKEKQEVVDDQGFNVLYQGHLEKPATKVTDSKVLDFLIRNFSVETVYSITANGGDYYVVNPLISGWTAFNDYFAIDDKGNDVTDVSLEGSADASGNMALGIDLPESFSGNIYVIFKSNGANVKALMISSEAGGDADEAVFTVTTNNGMIPIECTLYLNGDFGGADWIKEELGVEDLFEIKESQQSMDITYNASNISEYKCYDAESLSEITLTEASIADMGNNTLNVWLGDDTEITKNVLLVIGGDDGKKHGVFIHIN